MRPSAKAFFQISVDISLFFLVHLIFSLTFKGFSFDSSMRSAGYSLLGRFFYTGLPVQFLVIWSIQRSDLTHKTGFL